MKLAFVLLGLFFLLTLPGKSEPGDSLMYYRYTWQEFYSLPQLQERIDPQHPNYDLLDAAIFHAMNEARLKEGLPPFGYALGLHQAANQHATSIIQLDFYNHYNTKDFSWYHPSARITNFDKLIVDYAENIAQFGLIDTKTYYCLRKSANGEYAYYDCYTEKGYHPYTYLAYARYAVKSWMNSPSHRHNILNKHLNLLGCAARFSKNPFRQRALPFARLTQDFGAFGHYPGMVSTKEH